MSAKLLCAGDRQGFSGNAAGIDGRQALPDKFRIKHAGAMQSIFLAREITNAWALQSKVVPIAALRTAGSGAAVLKDSTFMRRLLLVVSSNAERVDLSRAAAGMKQSHAAAQVVNSCHTQAVQSTSCLPLDKFDFGQFFSHRLLTGGRGGRGDRPGGGGGAGRVAAGAAAGARLGGQRHAAAHQRDRAAERAPAAAAASAAGERMRASRRCTCSVPALPVLPAVSANLLADIFQ